MPASNPKTLTALLHEWNEGSREAFDELFVIVHDELRAQARRLLSGRRPGGPTLQPTALVHEAYLRLVDDIGPGVVDRQHFFRLVGQVMRWIATDHFRRAHAGIRFPPELGVPLDEKLASGKTRNVNVEELDEALRRLERLDPPQARIVELCCFVGLTAKEAAALLGVHEVTVRRDLRTAKAWLILHLTPPVKPACE